MFNITGYEVSQKLYESARTLAYRATRRADNCPVILKILPEAYPDPEQIAWFKREFEVIHGLDLAGVVAAYGLLREPRWGIVLEDFGGESLTQLGLAGHIAMTDFLELAIKMTHILGQVHQRHIIHKDINPANIVLNPTSGVLKLIDFGISTVLSRANQAFSNPNVLEGTLAYISPEQTGRMNRPIDYRTDYYSLGVTFYHLLTGQLPFESADPLELVHSHMAKRPLAPHELNADIPPILSEIILKLMAKNAQERYQSASGLKADLERCLRQLKGGQIAPFPLGKHDLSDKFQIPAKLYGRELEIEALLAAFERVNAGKSEMMLVSGYSGIGKSALVQELYKPLTEQRGYYVAGKFDQFQRNMPYSALIQAFRSLMRQLLAESKAQIAAWREKLLAAFGQNGQIIIDIIPEVELIVGPQPAPGRIADCIRYRAELRIADWKKSEIRGAANSRDPKSEIPPSPGRIADCIRYRAELRIADWKKSEIRGAANSRDPKSEIPPSPAEAQNRFKLVFQNFIKVFTRPEHPLVIFLDDLQWADSASLKWLEEITSVNQDYLFLMGAYRDNEVSDAHPLIFTLKEIQQGGTTLNQIALSALELPHVTQLIAETLHHAPQEVKPLAELVRSKTGGNPFFLSEFLKSLYGEGLITFDYAKGAWQWDLAQIEGRQITDNVVELMAGKVQLLPPETQEVLKLAACIGNRFDLESLAVVYDKSETLTAVDLWSAVVEGLILPLNDEYKLVEIEVEGLASRAKYKFAHDRVQQAVYSLIPEAQKQATHWRIGQLLLKKMAPVSRRRPPPPAPPPILGEGSDSPPLVLGEGLGVGAGRHARGGSREERLFDLVNQLNKGRALIESEAEQDQLAQLNLLAGQKAKAAAAYEAAFDYLQVGLELLCTADKDEQISSCWLRQYDLALALHEEGAEAAYLSGSFAEMARLAGVVQQQAKTRLDKVKVIEVQLQGYTIQNKLQKALQIGLEGLSLWDMTLPKRLHKLYIVRGLVSSKLALAGTRIEGLIYLPPMSNPNKLAMMRIMSNLGTVAFLTAPELVPLIVFKQIKLSVKYGHTGLAPYIYALYGMILCGAVGEIDKGYRFGQLALRVLERFNAEQVKAKTYFIVYCFISHWKEHLRHTLSPLREAYQSGLESGDLEYAAYAAQIYYVHSCWSGKNLAELEGEMASFCELLLKLKQETSLNYNKITQQFMLNLLGESDNPCRLQGKVYDEEQMRPLHQAANDNNALFSLVFYKFVLCYLFEAYSEAQLYAAQAEPYLEGIIGLINVPFFYFYDSLIQLALYPDLPKSKQKRVLKKVAGHQKKMKKWAKHAPMNHRHRYNLVEAERARVQGKDAEARECYDQAIDLARQNEYVNDEALAHELAARFYLAKGRRQIAEVYLRHAHSCYGRWGALGKVQQLEASYPDLLAQSKSSVPSPIGLTTAITSTQGGSSALDLISALKASQTMSGEIVLHTLLSKMMTIVIENAGAQRGVLILDKHPHKEGVEWVIQAEGTTNQKDITVLQAIPISSAVLPTSIINLVAHTHEVVVLDDAANEGTFTQDDYIKRHQPKSLLCTPLLNQGKLTGLLYLENNLTTAAFTPDRLEVLSLLSSQAAISLENAQLYNNISALNTAYERFVPRQFLSLLGKESIIDVQLGDQVEKEMTIVFTDIRDFTSISEKMSPTDNFQFVNNYLRRMERVIIEHNGFIDKYMGDGIMALFPTNADDAIRASIAMLRKLHALNLMRRKPIQIGIGVHTGLLMLGTVGGRNRMDGTVISDAVNLGARVEGLTKRYGASLLITQESYTRLQEPTRYAIREIDRVAVKGKSEPVTILELFDGDSLEQIALKKQTLADFELAITMYRQQEFAFAEKLFRQVLQLNPQDKAAKLYVARCQEYQQRDIPPEWDGVFVATTK